MKRVGRSVAAGEQGDGNSPDYRPGGGGKKENDGGGLRRQALPEVPLFFRISHVLLPSAASYESAGYGSILYPSPQTTFRYRGLEGSISSFSRRWRIWTATAPSEPKAVSFHTCS